MYLTKEVRIEKVGLGHRYTLATGIPEAVFEYESGSHLHFPEGNAHHPFGNMIETISSFIYAPRELRNLQEYDEFKASGLNWHSLDFYVNSKETPVEGYFIFIRDVDHAKTSGEVFEIQAPNKPNAVAFIKLCEGDFLELLDGTLFKVFDGKLWQTV